MNTTNVTTTLTSAITNSVSASDVVAIPSDQKTQLLNDMLALMKSHDAHAAQRAKDVAAANAIASKITGH